MHAVLRLTAVLRRTEKARKHEESMNYRDIKGANNSLHLILPRMVLSNIAMGSTYLAIVKRGEGYNSEARQVSAVVEAVEKV